MGSEALVHFSRMCEFPPCLYIVSLHKLIKMLIFHFIYKHRSAKCHPWWTWEAFWNRRAGGFSLQSYTKLHCVEFARSPIRGHEGFQPWATSHRAAVCNPDGNRIWKNPDRNGQVALPWHCAILHSHQLKFPCSLPNLSVWSTARGSLLGQPRNCPFSLTKETESFPVSAHLKVFPLGTDCSDSWQTFKFLDVSMLVY